MDSCTFRAGGPGSQLRASLSPLYVLDHQPIRHRVPNFRARGSFQAATAVLMDLGQFDFILKFFRSAIERIAMSIEALLHRVVASILFDGRSDKGRGWVHEYAFHKVASLGNEPLTSCPKSGPQRASRLLLLRSIAQVGLRLALRQRQNRPAGTTPHQQAKGPRLSCYPTPTCTGCQGAMRFACIR